MKRIMTTLIACGLASPLAVMAADEIKANVGIVSDYVFRGVSQTDNNPAVQGGVDYNHQRGLYAGAWATNVDIPGSDAKARLDLYGGYKMKLSSGLGFDAGLIAYSFVRDTHRKFWEVFAGVSLGHISGKVFHDPDNNNTYLQGALNYDIGSGIKVSLGAGQSFLSQQKDYTDVILGVSKNFAGLDLGLTFTDSSQKPSSDLNRSILALSAKYVF